MQRIFDLMDQLDRLAFTQEPNLGKDADWLPESPEGRAVFDQLTAPENLPALRQRYDRFADAELNSGALNLKVCLERAVGQSLT